MMRQSNASMTEGIAMVERTAAAIRSVNETIAKASAVSQEIVARSVAMNDSSQRITENVVSVASTVGESAAAAEQLRSTAETIAATVERIAAAAESQSAVASQVASASAEVASGVGEIAATAEGLRDQATALDEIVGRFKTGSQALAPLGAAPALTGGALQLV
jgi:methyl-accepting chemotaxis protein